MSRIAPLLIAAVIAVSCGKSADDEAKLAAKAPADETAPDTDPPSTREDRVFVSMPLAEPPYVEEWQLVTPTAEPTGLAIADASGQLWHYDEETKKMTAATLSLPVVKPKAVHAVSSTTGWVEMDAAFSLVQVVQSDSAFTLPSTTIQHKEFMSTSATHAVMAVYADLMVVIVGDQLVAISRGKDKLSAKSIQIPKVSGEILGAGRVETTGDIWFATHNERLVLTGGNGEPTWQRANITLTPPNGVKVMRVSGRVKAAGDGSHTWDGPVYAVSDTGLLWSEKGVVVAVNPAEDDRTYSWNLDVRTVVDQFCVQCHAEFTEESALLGKRDQLARRLAVTTKAESFAMPPPETVPSQKITDQQRQIILKWLAQSAD